MTRAVVAVLACLSTVSCQWDDQLSALCPETCYDASPETEGVGVCKAGVPTCDVEGRVLSCDGQQVPEPESCDGLDNNCDGVVDEALVIPYYDPENTCLPCGPCRWTDQVCSNGIWLCPYGTPPSATDSQCNGVDDDCDCQTDEDVHPDGEVVFCYDGPRGTATAGACRPGIESCRDGELVCEGQVTPTLETCDGTDQDCNGLVDDLDDQGPTADLLFAIDISGSMGPYIENVTQLVCSYATLTSAQPNVSIRMALLLIASPNGGYSLVQNLSDAATMCTALQAMEMSGGSEPTLSAAEAVVDPSNPLMIDWSETARRVFIGFGDEAAQTVDCVDGSCSAEDTVVNTLAYCVESQTSVYWFVTHPEFHMDQALGCGGQLFWLSSSIDMMMNNLNSILEDVCVSP